MAYPTAVNNQITDAITQSNVTNLASAPGVAAAMLYQAVAQAVGNAANNATYSQQQANSTMLATAAVGCSVIYAQQPKA